MTDSEQNNDVAPEADGMKSSSGARGFFAVIYKLAVLALLAGFVWEADQIRQELQSGSIDANVGSVYVDGGSIDANVDFPSRQSVYVDGGSIEVSGGSIEAEVEFPSRQDVYVRGGSIVVSGGSVNANVDFPAEQFVSISGTTGVVLDVEVKNTRAWPVLVRVQP